MKLLQECKVELQREQFHKCTLCPILFKNVDHLITHIKKHEDQFLNHVASAYVKLEKLDILECEDCGQSFYSKRQLLLHRVKHIQQTVRKKKTIILYENSSIVKPYKCEECNSQFAAESTLKAHSVVHDPFPHICHCGIGYYKYTDLQEHKSLVHKDDKKEHKKIEETDDETENIKPQKNEYEEKLKVKFDFKKKKHKKAPTTSKITIKSNGIKKVKQTRGKEVSLPQLDIQFKTNKLQQYQCPECLKWMSSKGAALIHYRAVHRGERPFSCEICHKSFTQISARNVHLAIHTGRKDFECSYCDKKFGVLYALINHERTHTGYKPYKCSFCDMAFSDKSAHTRHERIHTNDKRYKCPYCPMAFTDSSGLYHHKIIHNNQREHICNICSKRFNFKTELRNHINNVHERNYKYTCDYCKKKFPAKLNVLLHIQSKHTPNRKKYTCKLCFSSFYVESNLKRHLKVVHANEREYTCKLCFKQFDQRGLNAHMKSHADVKYNCDKCYKQYTVQYSLSRHIALAHNGYINCKQCKCLFPSESELEKHKLKESQFCDICNKELFCELSMNRHLRIHIKAANTYECDNCNRMFTNRSSIVKHIQKYHSKAKYICEPCGERFSAKRDIRYHIKTRHLKCFICNVCSKRFYSKTELKGHKCKVKTCMYTCKICNHSFNKKNSYKRHQNVHSGSERTKCPSCDKVLSSRPVAVRHVLLVHCKNGR